MALTPEVIQQLKTLSKFDPKQIDEMLQSLVGEDTDKWRNAVNLLLLTLWTEHTRTRQYASASINRIRKILESAVSAEPDEQVMPATAPPSMQSHAPTGAEDTLIGADGQPITDPGQIEAERMMAAASGVPLQTAAGPVAPTSRQQPGRRPRGRAQTAASEPIIGANGQQITDPEQIKAELIMRQTLGE